jgi:TrkA domain protein
MNFDETPLPGIGVRRELTLASGRRVGVVIHRDGGIDLIVSEKEDPDACLASVRLGMEEAAALGALLGAPQLVAQLGQQHSQLPGIETRQMVLGEASPYAGASLGHTHLRTRTGVSVVAVVRAGQVLPSPTPDFPVEAGDVLVVVGTAEALERAARLLAG